MTKNFTKEEFDEATKRYSIDKDPDNLGVLPQSKDHPEEYMKLFDRYKEPVKKKVANR